ncbi:uncharacterized protein BX663DRAFT_572798 [Cokeromyces recurvatus]|uniref:uncharacterized protein n=1 Tax=Cokeromyces recurvatus TaxID=90255 RepID=UPI00221F32CB|nr:uncharacterized protein BX663DRAFT_572798 [Cokeromyces recurvatus]KAI7906879.1 hypothetical protein BX663DRAFT_572798 [Cokeromyces recurvatus]
MQKEIESIQLTWQEEQQKLLAEIHAEHDQSMNVLQAENKKAEEQTANKELLKKKEDELTSMNNQVQQLQKEVQNSDKTAEELRTLKIAYENMLNVKDKEIKEAEERLEEVVSASQLKNDDSRVQSIVSQHQKEINVLQTQFQQLLDLKDKELESFSYRLKTVTASQQKDIEKLNEEYKQKLLTLDDECQKKEEVLKSKELEMRWMTAEFESSEAKLKDQGIKLQNLENDNGKLRQAIQQYKEENEQMLRQVYYLDYYNCNVNCCCDDFFIFFFIFFFKKKNVF